MRFFRHLMESFFNPFFIILIFFACLLFFLYKERKSSLLKEFLALFMVMIILGLGFIPQKITQLMENKYPIIHTPSSAIHWIVVLSGGQAQGTDKPANMMLYGASVKRLVEAVRIYRQLPQVKLLLSGGGVNQEIPEAKRLAILANWFDIPAADIVLENVALNTAEEAREIKKIINDTPFYLVTSAMHMHRAMLLCKNQGLNPIAAPTDFTQFWQDERWEKRFIPNAHNLVYLSIALHELLGLAWGKVSRVI